jgi:hypothetical protein
VVMGVAMYFMYKQILAHQKTIEKKDEYIKEVHKSTTVILKETTAGLKDVTNSSKDVLQDVNAHVTSSLAITEKNILKHIQRLEALYIDYRRPGNRDESNRS